MFISAQNSLTLIVSLVFIVISAGLVWKTIQTALQENEKIEKRLAGNIDGHPRSVRPNVLETLGNHLTLPDAEQISRIRFQLAQAGFYDASAVKKFYGRSGSAYRPVWGNILYSNAGQ